MTDDEMAFILELVDHVSKPAHEAKESLFGLGVSIEVVSKGIEKLADGLKDLAVESVKFAAEAAEFKENTELAYAAVLGTAEAGEETFRQIDALANRVHMPAQKAHEIASTLMLQGLEDTATIGKIIEARAALMRTGQIAGAEKLMKIAERSIVSGHLAAGKGGKAFAGLGISDSLAKELGKGQTTVEDGLDKIADAVINGPIGKVAAQKFGIDDFFTDIGNAIRGAAQDSSLESFNEALKDLDETIQIIASDGSLQAFFQAVVDDSAYGIEAISKFIDWTWGVIEASEKVFAKSADWKLFSDIVTKGVGYIVTGLKYFVTFVYGGFLEAVNAVKTLFEGLGAVAAFVGDLISDPLHTTGKWDNLKRTLAGIGHEFVTTSNDVGNLEAAMIDGTVAATKQEHQHKKVAAAAHHAGKQIQFMTDKAKAAKEIGIEDLVMVGSRIFNDKEAGGFIPQLKLPPSASSGSFALSTVQATATQAASSTVAKTGPSASGAGPAGKSVLWTGNVYVGADESASHLRVVVESAFIDAVDRLNLELGG